MLDFKKARAVHDQFTVPSAASVCFEDCSAEGSRRQRIATERLLPGTCTRFWPRRAEMRLVDQLKFFFAGCSAASPLRRCPRHSVHRRGAVQGRDCRYGSQLRMQHSWPLAPAPPGRVCRASPASPSCQREPQLYQRACSPSALRMLARCLCVRHAALMNFLRTIATTRCQSREPGHTRKQRPRAACSLHRGHAQ